MPLVEEKLGGVLDRDDALIVGNGGGERVQ
jgi:hypothetical protein